MFDPIPQLDIFLEQILHVLASLSEALALVREPRTALFDDVIVRCEIDQIAFARDAFAVHDVELGLAERRSAFVLNNLYAGSISDHAVAVLDRTDAANIQTDARVKLQSLSACRRFR